METGINWCYMIMGTNCIFCTVSADRIVRATEYGIAIRDSYPISRGHTLVISKDHVESVYDLPDEKRLDLWRLVGCIKETLQQEFNPAGFNIGINEGAAAGQTVPHAHIHIIPRYTGDVPDPRGGIRWIIAAKAKYWT